MNTFMVDAAGKLLHVINHEVRAVVDQEHVDAYVKNADFDTQLAYQRVQEDLHKQQVEAKAKADAELRKQTAGMEAVIERLVREKLAAMTPAPAAPQGAGAALNLSS